ncbi:hypothetical protein J6590_040621 [Homalodisca vitripennis]|nr:hypothetical protein J6590_040621 [Homalodisca vitripennis]
MTFLGKDGSVWCRKEPPKQRRTPQNNILRGPLPGPTARVRALGNNPLITGFEFIKRLTLKRIKPHMSRRLEIQNLPRDIRRVITEYVGETEAANPNECVPSDKLEKRKTCSNEELNCLTNAATCTISTYTMCSRIEQEELNGFHRSRDCLRVRQVCIGSLSVLLIDLAVLVIVAVLATVATYQLICATFTRVAKPLALEASLSVSGVWAKW